jgi:hypothetical protein
MKLARAATALALLAMPAFTYLARPAHAQMPQMNLIPELPSKTPEEKEADEARDKAYKESLKKIPESKPSSDPWGGVRSDAPKTTTAPAAKSTAASKKTKTGSSAN